VALRIPVPGNGKPPLLTSFPSPGVGSRKTENTADLSSDRALIIIIIGDRNYVTARGNRRGIVGSRISVGLINIIVLNYI